MPRRYKKQKKRTKKKTLRRRQRRRRRSKRHGGDYSNMAKRLMKAKAEKKMIKEEKQREVEFRNKMRAKIAARDRMTPGQLLMQRRIRVSPYQIQNIENMPHPLKGGKRTRRHRKKTKRSRKR